MSIDLANVKMVVENFIPFVKKCGIELLDARERYVKLAMPTDPSNLNHVATYHAGALFTFAETAGGALMMVSLDSSKGYVLIVSEASIKYLKPVVATPTIEATMTEDKVAQIMTDVEREGKLRIPTVLEVRNPDGQLAAEATITYYLRKPKQ